DLAQQRVETGAIAPLVNRVDPDEDAIERGELRAHGVEDIVLVDHRFRIDTDMGERREHGLEPAGVRRRTTARRFIAPPQDGDAAEATCGLGHGKRLRVHDRAPVRVSARTASRTWTGNRLCEAGSLRCPDARYIDSTCRLIKVQRPLS